MPRDSQCLAVPRNIFRRNWSNTRISANALPVVRIVPRSQRNAQKKAEKLGIPVLDAKQFLSHQLRALPALQEPAFENFRARANRSLRIEDDGLAKLPVEKLPRAL